MYCSQSDIGCSTLSASIQISCHMITPELACSISSISQGSTLLARSTTALASMTPPKIFKMNCFCKPHRNPTSDSASLFKVFYLK